MHNFETKVFLLKENIKVCNHLLYFVLLLKTVKKMFLEKLNHSKSKITVLRKII